MISKAQGSELYVSDEAQSMGFLSQLNLFSILSVYYGLGSINSMAPCFISFTASGFNSISSLAKGSELILFLS